MEEQKNTITYTIQQVSEMTKLSKQVIRKWEERYGVVNPERMNNRYRVYNQHEVNLLRTVKGLVDEGHTVKQAAAYVKQHGIVPNTSPSTSANPNKAVQTTYVQQLLDSGASCNEKKLLQLLQQAYHENGLKTFLDEVIIPFLIEVGNHWENGRWGEYQEAFSSMVVRDYLIQLQNGFQYTDNDSLILGACLPGERHEIPLHIILLQCMLHGWNTIMIGASPAPMAIQSTIKQLQPKKVLLSATTTYPFEMDEQLLQQLDNFAGTLPHIQFYLGGQGAITHLKGKQLQHITLSHDLQTILGHE
ncbi:MerR family transcriptional regulator [Virgibacillus sp. LDC-1]|uniref:MerR family transcriptional regulator n=1 Tax=Virgibacillus sp. LDC-1 TaxID=3039856 RepID=UPI0024DE3BF9|nr:MerR family transcriptional regulator [Virgibacillus sp. LDC-1]